MQELRRGAKTGGTYLDAIDYFLRHYTKSPNPSNIIAGQIAVNVRMRFADLDRMRARLSQACSGVCQTTWSQAKTV